MNRTCPEEKLRCSVYLATRRVSFVLNILCLENLWCSFWILRVFRGHGPSAKSGDPEPVSWNWESSWLEKNDTRMIVVRERERKEEKGI